MVRINYDNTDFDWWILQAVALAILNEVEVIKKELSS